MGAVRIVLYAEGAGELRSTRHAPLFVPGDPLDEDVLGAAHLLVRRTVEEARRLPARAIQFEEPLATTGGRIPRGSDFQERRTLLRLLTWPARPPDLAVVLVDRDGDTDRRRRLLEWVADRPVPKVVAVAVEEFEAWLVADPQAVATTLEGMPAGAHPVSPEGLARGEAKGLLARWIGGSPRRGVGAPALRREIAERAHLGTLARLCPAFEQFRQDLAVTPLVD